MNICMLTSSYPRFPGDIAGTFIESLAISIAQQDHRVIVLAPDDGTDPSVMLPDSLIEKVWFPYAPGKRLRVLGYAKSLEGDRRLKPLTYAMIPAYILAAIAHMRAVAKARSCDILHAHWVLPNGPAAAAVAGSLDLPLVISLHGSDVYVAEQNRLFREAAGWAFGKSSAVVACSSDLRDRAARLGAQPTRSQVIPYGASLERFTNRVGEGRKLRQKLRIADDTPVILALGRLVYKKGFGDLIAALPGVLAEFPGARLIIAGEGVLADELRAQANGLGVGHALVMPGRAAADEVPAYLAMADLFVMPSITDTTGNVDGLPNVVLEAMASGTAVIATAVGGIPSVLEPEKNGLLVAEKAPEQLTKAICRLLRNPAERLSYGEQARRLIEDRLTWDAIARRYVDLYAELKGSCTSRSKRWG